MFKDTLAPLVGKVSKEMSEMQMTVYVLKELNRECIKKKHW